MFKMFGSVRLVQEVTRSNRSSPSSSSLNAEIQVQTKQAQQDEQEQHSSITEPVSTVAIKPTATATATSPNTTANTAVTIEANNQVSNPENMYIQLPQTQPLNTSSTLSPLLSPSTKHIPKTQKLAKTNTNKPNYTTFRNIFLDLSSKPRKTSQKYTVRHYRTRQPSLTTNNNYIPRPASSAFGRKQHASVPSKIKVLKEEKKSKSQKLLCLWPLPIITRYMILLAFIISGLNTMGILELKCVAPSFVIYRWDFKNLTFSPFLFDFTLQDLFLFGWNVLIMGLFEESLAHTVGGTRRFIVLLLSLFALVSSIRIALGYLFSKSTGWALPILFFSNSMHECNKGK
jgi:hypothetical protein